MPSAAAILGLGLPLGGSQSGGAAVYQIDYTFEDPNDLVSPVPLASIHWDASLVPSIAQAGNVSTTFVIPTAPIWARVQLLSGTNPVSVVFTQYKLGVKPK